MLAVQRYWVSSTAPPTGRLPWQTLLLAETPAASFSAGALLPLGRSFSPKQGDALRADARGDIVVVLKQGDRRQGARSADACTRRSAFGLQIRRYFDPT